MVLAGGKASLLLSHILIIIIIILDPYKLRRVTSPAVFVTDQRNRRQIVRPNREWCAMTFISDRAYDVRPAGEKSGDKTHRLNIGVNFDGT